MIFSSALVAKPLVGKPTALTTVVPEDQQRYLMYTFYNAGYDGDPNFNWSSIETALKTGYNGIMLAVPWDQIYPTRNGPANWGVLDKQMARITELGGKVGLLIGLQRDLDRVDSFWPADGYARTYKNEVLYKAHAFQFSPAHQPTVDLAADFVKQVAQRYNSYQQQGTVLFMSVVNSPIMEQEYSASSAVLYQAGENGTVLDYSKPMIAGFRTWLTTKYGSIAALNTAWSRSYSGFNDVQPPGLNAGDIYAAFVGKPGKDWYAYRHKVHKAFVDQTTQAIKSVNSSYKVINQHGSVYDNLSVFRGSLGFKDYALNTDGVKVNDSPYYLHRFSMDILRSNLAPGKWVMNEIDGIDYARVGVQTYVDQITQSFTNGAKVITFSNFADAGGISFGQQIVQQVRAQGWLNQPVPAFAPVGTINLKLSQLVESGYGDLGIAQQYLQIYGQNGNQPVRIIIDGDILDNTVVTPVSSLSLLPPTVDCTTGTLTFKTAGGDGSPIEYGAIGLLNWTSNPTLVLDPAQRSGVPILLKARQSGNEVSYTFTTNCAGNKPPVLVKPVPTQALTQGTSYSYVIPTTTFADSDGVITNWALSQLPVGLTYDGTTRTISGAASVTGSSQATLTVTDNGGATAQQAITFVVTAPISPTTTTPTSPTTTTPSLLSIVAPAYDCTTGRLVFRTRGGDGSLIDYLALGVTGWRTDSVLILDAGQRTGVTLTLDARQNDRIVTYFFTTICAPANKPPVVVTPIGSQTATLGRAYSFVIPAATFSDPDGQLVTWSAANLPVGLTFDATTHTISGTPSLIGPNSVTITVTDNGGASVQAVFILQVLGNNTAPVTPTPTPVPTTPAPTTPTVPSTALIMVAPEFNCQTGKLLFKVSGGDGTPVEYFAVGIKTWSRDSVGFIVPWQRDGVSFTLQARQSGKVVTYSLMTSCSSNKPPVVVTPIGSQTATVGRSYSFVIPAATFSDPDGQLVSWSAANLPAGLTFDATTHTINGTPTLVAASTVAILVTDNGGASVQTTFSLQVLTNSVPRAMPTPTPLTLLAPDFDCTTGKITLRTSGGDGTPIEYMAVGIKDWNRDSVGTIVPWQRLGVTFTLKARQSSKEIAYIFITACGATVNPVPVPVPAPVAPAATALVVAAPQSRIVYQRNQANQANVPVMGQAPTAATRVEARLVPIVAGQGVLLDWTNLPLGAGNTFTAKLTHTGGWYRLEVRAWNGSALLGQQTVDRVGIGEVFVVAGQSNAYGGFEVRPGAADDRVSCLDYKDDNLAEALLPIRFSHMDMNVPAGPSNPKHIWAELGDKLASRLNVPILFLGAAQSGTGSEQWRQSADNSGIPFPDNLPYRRLGATLLHYIARTGARGVLWHQGEGDQGRTTQSYVDNMTVVINKSRQQSSNSQLPWVVSRATYVYGVTDANIIAAQNRLINEQTQVFPGPETDQLGPAYRPIDNVHISGTGATRFVDMWDQSLNTDFFSRSVPFSVGDSPQITTGYVLTGTHLAGQALSVPYVVSGNADATALFSVQIIRAADGAVVATLGSGRDNPMVVTLPGNLTNGLYRAKVVSGSLMALAGESFIIGSGSGRQAAPETMAGSWQAWPNPVERELTIAVPTTVTAATLRVVLSTISGLDQPGAIESTRVENGRLHLQVGQLQTGMYFLHVYNGEQRLQTLKVLKR